MLDLDAIANRRAESLSQERTVWRSAVWSPPFQSLSARLTDGEVEELLELCGSADVLDRLTRVLGERAVGGDETPLDWLKREARGRDLSPAAWVERFVRGEDR